jgi:hypothetical protein
MPIKPRYPRLWKDVQSFNGFDLPQMASMARIGLLVSFFVLCLCACNLPTASRQAVITPEVPSPTNTERVPSPTSAEPTRAPTESPVPSATPSPSPTPEPSPPTMRSLGMDLICRFGPGLRYGVGGSLRKDVTVMITARNGAGDWFQFELPGYPGKYCWVAALEVEASGDLGQLNIAQAPLSFVTNVSVLLDPPVLEPATCVFPLTFNVTFSIETIGPTFVTFKRSRSDGASASPETVEFTEAGPKMFEDSLRVDSAGEHWFKVTVTSPNSLVGQAVGQVICP